VTPLRIYDIVPAKESAMLQWIVGFWQKFNRWMHGGKGPQTYHRSNLHGRHR
jgi:hypothetical protein